MLNNNLDDSALFGNYAALDASQCGAALNVPVNFAWMNTLHVFNPVEPGGLSDYDLLDEIRG